MKGMNETDVMRKHLGDLKSYASKGMAKDRRSRFGIKDEEATDPGTEGAEAMPEDEGAEAGSKPANECSTEELLALLKERMGKESEEVE